ncbi:hypothetical protein NQZ68_039158 [Dissostichus eleginoides]|nr:hypothetical protein NQZ68_039158 [Dissostichus eleginoides]
MIQRPTRDPPETHQRPHRDPPETHQRPHSDSGSSLSIDVISHLCSAAPAINSPCGREGRFPEVKALLFLRGEVPEGPRGHGVTSPGDISSRGQSAQDAHQQLSVNQQLEIG